MSYPQKISRDVVLQTAMALAESHGMAALSMRSIAAELGVTPNALYRYFASKAELEYAMADEVGRMLLRVIEPVTQTTHPLQALPAVARAYIQFARQHPELYGIKLRYCNDEVNEPASHAHVWQFVIALAEGLNTPWPAEDLALSLWAFLHGMVELDRAKALNGRAPEDAMLTGLEVMIAGLLASAGQGSGVPATATAATTQAKRRVKRA
jgi:AcrR family transcriptional regulator